MADQRLADEYDAAQDRGEIATVGKRSQAERLVDAPPSAADLGLTRKQVHQARQIRDAELMKMATRIRDRAIRRAGELLKQIEPQSGKRTDIEPSGGAPTRLEAAKDAGMSRDQMHTALRVANVSTAEFERQVESANPPTVTAVTQSGTLFSDW
jgi:replicative DNA helicase